MDENLISRHTDILIQKFYHVGVEDFNLEREIGYQKDYVTGRDLTPEEKEEIKKRVLIAINYKQSHDTALLIPISVISDPKKHEEWYEDWLDANNNDAGSYYWKRLEKYLSQVLTIKFGPEKAGRVVKSIDEATSGIMSKLANPLRAEFNYKGLVVGYVQSGKTANFTTLIAKAADAGYKFIVVFSGIHNILRKQTQLRLDKELTGMNDLGLTESLVDEPGDVKKWNRLTTYQAEFSAGNQDPFASLCRRSTPTLAVIKKNGRVLSNLIRYIEQADDTSRAQMPLLIIDDEADQASINIHANDPDDEPSRTNERMRTLLALFPKKAYIGYTATPFANVLIDMTIQHERLEDDLYPRNFVVALPHPEEYFGASTIFGGNLSDLFVREIPDERSELVLSGQLTENLSRAIDEFIICCAVRNLRGDRTKPMSMLVHVTHKICDMSIIRSIVVQYHLAVSTKLSDKVGRESLHNDYSILWENISDKSKAVKHEQGIDNLLPAFNEIWNEISGVIKTIKIVELNSASEDVLDYSTNPELKVIAIGGNQLSRGLTLEGLMTSYYLRPSNQYDTLLQMGRWFGYRRRYEDLTRIYTTSDIRGFFEHLALVEEEIRSEIYRYEEENRTPAELAIAIRDHRTLKVTAPNKMGAAKMQQISYSESLNQTIWFPLDNPDILKVNYEIGDRFMKKISAMVGFQNKNGLFLAKEKISVELVLKEFLSQYTFVNKDIQFGPGLDSARLLEYIYRRSEDQYPELQNWSVVLVGNVKPTAENRPIIYGGITINRIQRSRKYTENGYNIGVLTEPDHLKIDLDSSAKNPYDGRSPQNPLLLLYLIWKESKASLYRDNPRYGQRIDLYRSVSSEKVDLLGVGIVLPKSEYETSNYIGQ